MRPRFECYVCGLTLYEREYERHVARCCEQHADELDDLRNHVAKRLPQSVDPELEAWARKYGEAIMHGRVKM